jgi:hypothetical protein
MKSSTILKILRRNVNCVWENVFQHANNHIDIVKAFQQLLVYLILIQSRTDL